MLKQQIRTKDLTKMAIMTALVCLATFSIKIPSIHGYTHLGDSMIFISVLILGYRKGALSSGIGAALADLLGGWAQWIVPTFFIKLIMAVIMGLITEKLFPKFKFAWIIGAIVGGMFQIVAYTLVTVQFAGKAYALSALPGEIVQTVSGIILAFIIVTTLLTSGAIKKLKDM